MKVFILETGAINLEGHRGNGVLAFLKAFNARNIETMQEYI